MIATFSMGGDYIGEFPETAAAYQLADDEHKEAVLIRGTPSLCLVVMPQDYSSKLSLWQKSCYLGKDERSNKHIYVCFCSGSNMQISSLGQGVCYSSNCAYNT